MFTDRLKKEQIKEDLNASFPWSEQTLNPPGFLSDYIECLNQFSDYHNPPTALCEAISILGFLTSSKIVSENDISSNLFVINSPAPQNFSLHNFATIYDNSLSELEINSVHGAFGSEEAFEEVVYETDSLFLIRDDHLGSLTWTFGNNYAKTLITIEKLFSSSSYKTKSYVKRATRKIQRPCLNLSFSRSCSCLDGIYGLDKFEKLVETNVFGKFINFATDRRDKRVPKRDYKGFGPSPKVLEIGRYWKSRSQRSPMLVVANEGAKQIQGSIEGTIKENILQSVRKDDRIACTLWSHASINIEKLSLIYAASENKEEPKITTQGVAWAKDIVFLCVKRAIEEAKAFIPDKTMNKINRIPLSSLQKEVWG